VFHVELRRFPHVARAFNVSDEELRTRYVIPWVRGSAIALADRRWTPDNKTRLTIYEGSLVAPEERGLGRGWSAVTREGADVTEQLLDEARKAVAPAVPLSEVKAALLDRARKGPVRAGDAVAIAGGRGRVSERLALTEQAVWELVHEGRLSLADGDGPVASDRWESLLLAWETWTDPSSAVVLQLGHHVGDQPLAF
jgi:hypothetical protein